MVHSSVQFAFGLKHFVMQSVYNALEGSCSCPETATARIPNLRLGSAFVHIHIPLVYMYIHRRREREREREREQNTRLKNKPTNNE